MGSLERRLDELRSTAGRPRAIRPPPPRLTARVLQEVIGGGEARCGGRAYWELTVPFKQVCEVSPLLAEALAEPLECEVATKRPSSSGPRPRAAETLLDPKRTLVMDIETGGFSGTPVFLIGVVALDRQPLYVEQWLVRDYPEEEAILRRLAQSARERTTWVTFNGKTFDAPFVLDRATVHGVKVQPPRVHVDLLHAARRRWGGRLPDCRLETVERLILGRTRIGDVPGRDIPDLFHHFIRTRNPAPLRPVLEHNRLDLVSSTELLRLFSHRPGQS